MRLHFARPPDDRIFAQTGRVGLAHNSLFAEISSEERAGV